MFEAYKKGQGRVARTLSTLVLGAFGVFGCYALNEWLSGYEWAADNGLAFGGDSPVLMWSVIVSAGVFLLFAFGVFALLHYRKFVDYLINCEAELRKVSWPTRPELKRQTIVVLITLALFGAMLFVVDLFFGYGSRLLFLVER